MAGKPTGATTEADSTWKLKRDITGPLLFLFILGDFSAPASTH